MIVAFTLVNDKVMVRSYPRMRKYGSPDSKEVWRAFGTRVAFHSGSGTCNNGIVAESASGCIIASNSLSL